MGKSNLIAFKITLKRSYNFEHNLNFDFPKNSCKLAAAAYRHRRNYNEYASILFCSKRLYNNFGVVSIFSHLKWSEAVEYIERANDRTKLKFAVSCALLPLNLNVDYI